MAGLASELMSHGVESKAAAVIASSINRQKVALDPSDRDMVLKVLDDLVGLRAERANPHQGGGEEKGADAVLDDGRAKGGGVNDNGGVGTAQTGEGQSSGSKIKAALKEERDARKRERKLKRMIKADKKQAKEVADLKARTVERVPNPALAGKNVRLTLRTVANAGDCKVVVMPRGEDLTQVFATAKKKFVSKKNKLKKPKRAFLVEGDAVCELTGEGMLGLVDGDVIAVSEGEAPAGFVGGDEARGGDGNTDGKRPQKGGQDESEGKHATGGTGDISVGEREGAVGGISDGRKSRGGYEEAGGAAVSRLRHTIERRSAEQNSLNRLRDIDTEEESVRLELSRTEHAKMPQWGAVS